MSSWRPSSLAGFGMGAALLAAMLAAAPGATAQTAHVVLGPEAAETRLGHTPFRTF